MTCVKQGESQIAVNAGKLNFTKKAEAIASAPVIPKLVAPAGSAAAEVVDKKEEEIVAPTVRSEKKKEEAPPKVKQNLSALIDEWGDDEK
jgi:hypothetical protein